MQVGIGKQLIFLEWPKLPFLGAHFSNFPPIFPAFCSLLLPTYFSKKNSWQNWRIPRYMTQRLHGEGTNYSTVEFS